MKLNRIQVHVDESENCVQRIKYAAAFARRYDAKLRGVYIRRPLDIKESSQPHVPQSIIDDLRQQGIDTMRLAQNAFNKSTQETAHQTQWIDTESKLVEGLSEVSKYADVNIFGQELFGTDDLFSQQQTDTIVMACGRPVLYVPAGYETATIAEDVTIAWDGSRQAVRAITDAIPILGAASNVHLLSARPESNSAQLDTTYDEILAYLAEHGIHCKMKVISAKPAETEEKLFAQVYGLKSDLLIMGAYGHSRFREFLLGGMTRHALRHASIPVFMSH